MTPRIRKVSLAAQLQLSSRPHIMMLKKFVLRFQRKRHHVGSEINRKTAKIHLNVDTGCCVKNALYFTIRNALVQQTTKNYDHS
jgi:hypothetical protein